MFDIKIVAEEGPANTNLSHVEAHSDVFPRVVPIDRIQRRSIKACEMYAATIARTTEDMIEEIFCYCFELDDVADLPAHRYEEAVQWFADFDVKRFIQ